MTALDRIYHENRMVPDPKRPGILTAVCRDDCRRCAVDALYQAAAKVLDLDYGYEAGHPAWDALAAAVRRVDGEA